LGDLSRKAEIEANFSKCFGKVLRFTGHITTIPIILPDKPHSYDSFKKYLGQQPMFQYLIPVVELLKKAGNLRAFNQGLL
jgi:hypothetical protein